MVTLEQLQKVDGNAADWVATLRASVDGHPQEDQAVLAKEGMRGLAVGKLTSALQSDDRSKEKTIAYRHRFSEIVFGVTSSKDWTQAQAHALAYWLDDGGDAYAEQIVTSADIAAERQEAEPTRQGEREMKQEVTHPLDGVKTISATYGRKFNLGNFESLEISMTAWADVPEESTLNEVQAELWDWLKDAVKTQALPVIRNKPVAQRKNETKQVSKSPTSADPSPPRPSAPPVPLATSPPPVTAPTQSSSSGGIHQTETVKITAPSGKPVVEFWRPGRNYAEIRHQLGGEALLKLCPALADSGWVAAHFDDIGKEYTLPLTILWVPSPKNAKWQDIVSITMR